MRLELYVKHWCPWCVSAREFLDRHGFAYTVHDLESEPGAREFMHSVSGQSKVPTLLAGSLVLPDFGPEELSAFLQKHGITPDSVEK